MAQETVREQFTTASTKAGVEIRYQDETHSYWVRGPEGGDWVPCDFSMSGVADCLNKPGLPPWAFKMGLKAVGLLAERGFIRHTPEGQIVVMGAERWELIQTFAGEDALLYRAKEQKVTQNDHRDKAGDRGNSVHAALEAWVKDQVMPVADFYPIEEQGYVRGLIAFLTDLGPLKSKPQAEIMVGSVEHRIAGRYDLEAVLQGARLVTKKASPKWTGADTDHHSAKGPVYTEFKGRTLFDLKTSKGIYLGQKLQMTGYEGCRLECGMQKTEQQLIVSVGDDGTYMVGVADTTWEEFLNVLSLARMSKEKG